MSHSGNSTFYFDVSLWIFKRNIKNEMWKPLPVALTESVAGDTTTLDLVLAPLVTPCLCWGTGMTAKSQCTESLHITQFCLGSALQIKWWSLNGLGVPIWIGPKSVRQTIQVCNENKGYGGRQSKPESRGKFAIHGVIEFYCRGPVDRVEMHVSLVRFNSGLLLHGL